MFAFLTHFAVLRAGGHCDSPARSRIRSHKEAATGTPSSALHEREANCTDPRARGIAGGLRASCIASAHFRPLLLLLLAVFALAPLAQAAQVTLRWADNSNNESGFRVERATGTGSFSRIATTGPNVTSYLDTTLAAGTTYRYRVCAYNSAGNSGYSNTASITTSSSTTSTTSSSNTAPTISTISSRTISMNGTTGAISFTIGDAQTAASNLKLTKNSSNLSLVPLSNITFGGSGANRTVTVKPAANKTGWSTIWVKVSDGQLTRYVAFTLTVATAGSVNTAPTISSIADRTITVNGTTGAISFTIADSQTSASSLTLVKNSSDTSVVPLGNITFGGSGGSRTVTVKPAANKTGWSTIWVKVSDGQLYSTAKFVVSVQAAPTSSGTTTSVFKTTSITGSSTGTTSDQLRFSYVSLSGDSELTVKVTSLADTKDTTRGGLMYRNSTAANSACVGIYVTGASRLVLVSRSTSGAALQTVAPLTGSAPHWLRLTRVGDTFYGFTSSDGATWEFLEFAKVDLTTTALAGTAAAAAGGATTSTAVFSNILVD